MADSQIYISLVFLLGSKKDSFILIGRCIHIRVYSRICKQQWLSRQPGNCNHVFHRTEESWHSCSLLVRCSRERNGVDVTMAIKELLAQKMLERHVGQETSAQHSPRDAYHSLAQQEPRLRGCSLSISVGKLELHKE